MMRFLCLARRVGFCSQLAGVGLSVLLAGCAHQPQSVSAASKADVATQAVPATQVVPATQRMPDLSAKLAERLAQPPTASAEAFRLPHQRAADLAARLDHLIETPSQAQFHAIETGYQTLLTESPDYLPAERGLYSLYYFAVQSGLFGALQQAERLEVLREQFNKLPPGGRQDFYPPDFAQLQWLSQQKPVDEEQLYQAILKGAKQAPQNAEAQRLLGQQWTDRGFPRLAVAQLTPWFKRDSESFRASLAYANQRVALQADCVYDERDHLKTAISLYKPLVKSVPKPEWHASLGQLYGFLGHVDLARDQAKRLAATGSQAALWQAAALLTRLGDPSAQALFDQLDQLDPRGLVASSPYNRSYIEQLMFLGQTNEAIRLFPGYLKAQGLASRSDPWLLWVLWQESLRSDKPVSPDDLWPEGVKRSKPTVWGEYLFMHLWDPDKAASDWQEAAVSSCQLAERELILGYEAYFADDRLQAERHWQAVAALDLPLSFESLLAKSLLARLKRETLEGSAGLTR